MPNFFPFIGQAGLLGTSVSGDPQAIFRHSVNNVNTGNAISNPDGSFSTVRSASVQDERLNNGQPTLIPTIWDGKELDPREAIKKAIASKEQWPAFETNQQADIASFQISQQLRGPSQGLLNAR